MRSDISGAYGYAFSCLRSRQDERTGRMRVDPLLGTNEGAVMTFGIVSAAGVADNCQAKRAQVMEEDLETIEPPQGSSVIIFRGDMARDVPHDAAAGLDDGQRL